MHLSPSNYRPLVPESPPARSEPTSSISGDGPTHSIYTGHAHFWERALSRRQIIRTAAGTAIAGTAISLGSGLLLPQIVGAKPAPGTPRPIPETIFPGAPFHVLSPGSEEPSTITDFNGLLGATEIQGTGTDGLLFDVDMRFMQGTYVGLDGQMHHDTYGFV
jgi:hypothetical protein